MFKKATESVVKNCGGETLHPVTDLNSAEHFKPLCVVEKKTSFWPFKAPTFIPTCVKITDLLVNPVEVGAKTKEFTLLKSYNELPTLDIGGSINASMSSDLKLDLKGDEKVKLVMQLGDIEKCEVPWQQLHKVLQTNAFKCQDQVYVNAKRSGRTLCVVIESICTKGDGSVSEDTSKTGSVEAAADISKFVKTAIVPEIHSNGKVEKKEDKSFVLPPNTVLAYGCVEFSVGANSFVRLHSTYDQLDGCAGEMLSDPNYSNSHENPAVSIPKIEAELQSVMKSPQFGNIQREVKALLSDLSSSMEFRMMEILMHAASTAIEDSTEEKTMPFATLKRYTDALPTKAVRGVLTLLGFTVPADDNDDSTIVFPTSDADSILKSFVGLVDSLLDVSVSGLKELSKISHQHLQVLLRIVQDLLERKDVDVHAPAIETALKDDPNVLHFLTECGFLKLHKEKKLVFTDHHSNLLDIYAVIYFLSATA